MTHNRCPRWQIDLYEILPPVPLKRCGEEASIFGVASESAVGRVVRIQDDLICPGLLDTDTIVREALARMEIEYPQQACPFEDDDFVLFVLETHMRLRRMQPAILLLCPLHFRVEVVQELVSEIAVFGQIQLTTCVPKAIVVSFPREIQPFWVSEFVALKIKVSLTAQRMSDQPNHLV